MTHEYDDPSRNDAGQFYAHTAANATVGQQFIAGVNQSDNYQTAQWKVEQHRRLNGLDPYTGLVPLVPLNGSIGHGPYIAPSRPGGTGSVVALGKLIKVAILWPAAIAIALGVIVLGLFGLLMLCKSLDGPTLTARAAKNEFGYFQPVPLTSRFTAKELASPVKPASLLAMWEATLAKKATVPERESLAGLAYRCMFQEGCRDGLTKLDAGRGAGLPRLAAVFLGRLAKSGDPSAARDLCLFSINAGSSYKDMLTARYLCGIPQSKDPVAVAENLKAYSQIEGAWSMQRAQIYVYIDKAEAAFDRKGFSGLASFITKYSPFTYDVWAVL
jgi:hypothetical protein